MASSLNASNSGAGGLISTADASGVLQLQTASTTAVTIDTSQNVGIGTTSPTYKFQVSNTNGDTQAGVYDLGSSSSAARLDIRTSGTGASQWFIQTGNTASGLNGALRFYDQSITTERMRIDSSGGVWIATGQYSTGPATSSTLTGFYFGTSGELQISRSGNTPLYVNRITNDGDLVSFRQDGTQEGTISVSGTTVSYNGGHLSRWSQFYNETGKPEVYRGTVLESVDAMCVWEKDGQPLPNEQATKTIVSTTPSSKAVAGVFDTYDSADQDNPYDFYVAQSGDFVIRIAQGVTVQNGDLLESAGDGTARPQSDDICRSSTVAKVTSNYVSATYEDGSYCVPCILMIG